MTEPSFKHRAAAGLADTRVRNAVRLATLHKVATRQAGMDTLRNPEQLRTLAAQIKQHTLERLPDYLELFAARAAASGAHVHFAPDAAAANRIVCDIARAAGSTLAVKAKSMVTEEIHLNAALNAAGLRVVETDLGEFIVQIDHDRPSHIVTPIIHKDRRRVAEAMQREIGCTYTEDPRELSEFARAYLRGVFRRCDLGITGVNFAIAETGSLCVCTNEGNGRMTMTCPRVHIALMGIEKLIPRLTDLTVFLKLLARSSTGQPLTTYTTLVTGPRRPGEPDGPEALHVVILDNGRSRLLGGEYESVLRCIRCGACLNACPVYRSIGGHAYGGVYPGPIGALITPLLGTPEHHAELPRASSLCGACALACPVRIDIPELLVSLRRDTLASAPVARRLALRGWRWLMGAPRRYQFAQRMIHRLGRRAADGWIVGTSALARASRLFAGPGPLEAWLSQRDLPPLPPKTFRELWTSELDAAKPPE